MILDSIQSDVMQVNKGMKEFLMESKCQNSSMPEIENIHLVFCCSTSVYIQFSAQLRNEESPKKDIWVINYFRQEGLVSNVLRTKL